MRLAPSLASVLLVACDGVGPVAMEDDAAPSEVVLVDTAAPELEVGGCVAVALDDRSCDGVDDDCDTQTDEDFVPRAVTCDEDACEATAFSSCVGGVEGDACRARAGDDASCDGVDEDCDGMTDEDFVVVETACGEGACVRAGEARCVGGRVSDTCVAGVGVGADASCDGVDDDCDGKTDEEFVGIPTICGTGACVGAGEARCAGGRVSDTCVAAAGADADVACDGVDEDCDGATDEDYAPRVVACGDGECAGARLSACAGGSESAACSGPVDADCDGVDDDCDGATDEDYAPRVTTCGTGFCRAFGVTRCDGVEHDSCAIGDAHEGDATCDGIDDDCDGATDEDFVGIPTICGKGVCVRAGETRCLGGGVRDTCVPGMGTADTSCDGADDDCDGATDEDYVAGVSSCGLGACAASGTTACEPGGARDVCAPLEADCANAQCGDDGCGGSCGTCPPSGSPCLVATCSARQCLSVPVANGTACDDGVATTQADWCWDGECRGFEPFMEPPPAGAPMDWFDLATSSPLSEGAVALARIPTGAQRFYLHMTTYGAALQGVTQALGSEWIPGLATPIAPGIVVEQNNLWEWVQGTWSNTRTPGSLRAAWPDTATSYTRFDHIVRSSDDALFGTGRLLNGTDLVVRHCMRPWTCMNEPVAADTIKNAWSAGLVSLNGEVLIIANDKQASPTKHRVLRFDGAWAADAALDHAAGGRLVTQVALVGDAILVTLQGGGLAATRLDGWTDITVPGLANVTWDAISEWNGLALVLGHVTVGVDTVAVLASSPADTLADWTWRQVATTAEQERIVALAGDDQRLFLFGSSRDAVTEHRTTWRYALHDDDPSFVVSFGGPLDASWQSVAQGSVGAPSWSVANGALVASGDCYDSDQPEAVTPKLGALLWTPAITWGDGRLTVAVDAVDDDGWGVVYGLQDADHGYRISFDAQRSYARLVRFDGATVTVLAEDLAFEPALNHWHGLEILRGGAGHTIILDGVPVLEAVDATYATGGVGLYAWQMSDVRFDDLTIY